MTLDNSQLPVPADFKEKYKTLRTLRLLQKHYKVGRSTIYRWIKEEKIERVTIVTRPARPAPPDFVAQFNRLRVGSLVKAHYGIGADTLTRWCRETGVNVRPIGFAHTISREGLLTALIQGQSYEGAARLLGTTRAKVDCAIEHHKIYRAEWWDDMGSEEDKRIKEEERQARLSEEESYLESCDIVSVVRGAATVIQNAISEWSREMGMGHSKGPSTPPNTDVALLEEEMEELKSSVTLVDDLDALADIVYTCFNIAYRRNLPLAWALAEVHRSNMTKDGNEDGKPTKGAKFKAPDLETVLVRWSKDAQRRGGRS